MWQQHTQREQRSWEACAVEIKYFAGCVLSGAGSVTISRQPLGTQIHSIKVGLPRGQRDCINAEQGLFSLNQLLSCPKSKEIMFD